MKKAAHVCMEALAACTTPDGIVAGRHHFVDLWARDSLFATFGAEDDVARKTIETFFRFQRKDGAVPYRIFRRFGWVWPNFRSVQSGGFIPDGGLMAIIAAKKYGNMYQQYIDKARDFYTAKFDSSLISEWFQCEWADATLKIGRSLYTNTLYWMVRGDEKIKKQINDVFWQGDFFADWVDYKRHDYFASHPNMLAIIFGLTNPGQAEHILSYAKKYCWNGWTLEENYPTYPAWRIPLQNYLVGMGDYHNRGCLWLQPGILYAVALWRHDQKKDARHVLQAIGEKIVQHEGVYEVYEKNGLPVRRLAYQSEQPFAWSAGLYLWAYHIIYS